jgi:hypothetical protein
MIIHSYFTNGFFPWAKFFVESFVYHNAHHNLPIKLDAINITQEQADELHTLYDNLEIFRHKMDLEKIAEKYNISHKEILRQKKEIETFHITPQSKSWKLLIAGDLRIKSIYDMLDKFPNDDILHFDIDSYIRGDISYLLDLVENNDICVRFRLYKPASNRKFLIAVMGYKNNENSREFLQDWIKVIESVNLPDRRIGWGQTSYYEAYLACKDKYKWGDVPESYSCARGFPGDTVWGANNDNGKTKNLKLYIEDFNKHKELA